MSRIVMPLLCAGCLLAASFTAAADEKPEKPRVVLKSAVTGPVKVVVTQKKGNKAKLVIVLMNNGKVYQGTVVKESKTEITLELKNKQKVTLARKDIEELRELKKYVKKKVLAKAGAAVVLRQSRGTAPVQGLRYEFDPRDPKERLLLLAPGGPIVVEATILLDGEPFRAARERLVEELLKEADTDGDKKPTWAEAVANRRFGYGRFAYYIQNKAQREATVKRYDRNGNGLVDKPEARTLIAQLGGGAVFGVQPASTGYSKPNVRKILDVDGNGLISKDELAHAAEQLKSRDANDNDLLEVSEAGGGAVSRYRRPQSRSRGNQQPRAAYLLGPTADLVAIYSALKKKYAVDSIASAAKHENGKITPECFPRFPNLVTELDLDKNGELDSGELIGLHLLKPHIVLEVHLGKSEQVAAGIRVVSMAAELKTKTALSKKFADKLSLELPGLTLSLSAPIGRTYVRNYARTAQAYLTRYDTNKNGYLEKEEFKKVVGANQALLSQFNRWDLNADGKVYPKEIEESYTRQLAPRMSAVSAASALLGPSFFSALDETGDNRLSLREMKNAAVRLATFDKNNDGTIDGNEMPLEFTLAFNRGGYYYGNARRVVSGGRIGTARAQPAGDRGPEWFVRMDKNGDGDLTLREFLGGAEKFKQLDTNGDDFIERKEAQAAEKR